MATKKAAPKKAAVKSAKSPAKPAAARTAVKAPAKPASNKAAVKAAPRNAAPAKAAKKAAPVKSSKKAAPVKAVAKKAAPKAAPKPAPKAVKLAPPKAAPKPLPKKAAPAPAKAAPKAPAKPAPKAPAPAPVPKKAAEPVKKPAVSAPSAPEVKPAIKPLAPAKKKEEPKKPFVIPKTTTTKSVKYDPEFTKSVLDANKQQSNEGPRPAQRYSDADLVEFRELINRKLETAKKELLYLQGLITRKDEGGDLDEGRYMTLEDGSMSMEREQLSQMASRQIQFIDHLEKAIMRIENKTYGICRVTGKLIDKARLRAVPHATLSIEAKTMMNK
ncbi:MAG: TraR/DksA family transcriptional regulator [Chitinophagaceae bacterium]|nr:MAG: TraR/DksA family transcriptional regulator [Chitinophagaceae bacterium]